MSLFVDTSALLALVDDGQPGHREVAAEWRRAVESERLLLISNYIQVESIALVQRRIGMNGVRILVEVFLPLMSTIYISEQIHRAATAALLVAGRRRLSFVDCVSFELMRECGIREALTLDADFERQGFRAVPGPAAAAPPRGR